MSLRFKKGLIEILIISCIIMLVAPLRYIVAEKAAKIIDFYIAIIYILSVLVINFFSRKIKEESIDEFIKPEDSLVYRGVLTYVFSIILGCIVNYNVTDIFGVGLLFLALLPFFVFLNLSKKIALGMIFRRTLCICTVIGIVICIYEFIFLGNIRPCGLLDNANNWAGYLGFILPISIYGVVYNRGRKRILYFLLSAGIIVCLLCVKSRAMLLGLVELVMLYFFFKLYKYNLKLFIGVIVFLSVSTILSFSSIVQFLARGYDNDRLQAYYAAICMFKDHFWFGVGYTQFQTYYINEYIPSMEIEFLPHAHSMYLQYLATTGICGFMGLMVFVYCLLRSLYLKALYDSYYLTGIVGIAIFLFHGFFDSPISNTDFYRVFWLFVAIYNINVFKNEEQTIL